MRNPSSLTATRTIIPTPLTAALCGGGKSGVAWKGNRNHKPQNTRTRTVTSLVTRTATGIMTGNVIDPKRVITDVVWISLADAPHNAKTTTSSAAVIASARDCADMRVPSTTTKQSRDVERAPVHCAGTGSHTPPNVNLYRLCPYFIQHL